MLSIAVIFFILNTIRVVLHLVPYLLEPSIIAGTVCEGDVCLPCDGVDSPGRVRQLDIGNIISPVAAFILITLMGAADALLTYRAWIIWQRRLWIIILPGLLVAGMTGKFALHTSKIPSQYRSSWVPLRLLRSARIRHTNFDFSMASFIATAIANALVTTLIVSRLWWITRSLNADSGTSAGRKSRRVMSMVTESGAVLCFFQILLIILNQRLGGRNIFVTVIQAIQNHTAAIVPTLIIVRVGLGQSTEHATAQVEVTRQIEFTQEQR
ncbi:hypothetical protein JAAARDRAFT_209439 [Jaapia argillacea MUCL 33604]|uniref:G-protein coupled receptors family 1 profile domain-containing protein n=1 Tax=Jaapia argillacea MUCL 33604 TaxID=933084 RepID=A0A067PVG8_9AGAM|nr:hypothetical protein JAAARDRAFT_209439 [Jaapia argillacea MUCL 33604]